MTVTTASAKEVLEFGAKAANKFPAGDLRLNNEVLSDTKKLAEALERLFAGQRTQITISVVDPGPEDIEVGVTGILRFEFGPEHSVAIRESSASV